MMLYHVQDMMSHTSDRSYWNPRHHVLDTGANLLDQKLFELTNVERGDKMRRRAEEKVGCLSFADAVGV